MTKKVAIVAAYSSFADFQSRQLRALFSNHVEVFSYAYNEGTLEQTIDADLILTTMPYLHHILNKFIPKETPVLNLNTTITNQQYNKIMEIPSGTQVLVVNDSVETTIETIVLFHHLGIDHINFIPSYPQIKNTAGIEIAVTPAEAHLAPSFVKKIIDIGHRVIDADTITEIAIRLDLEHLLNSPSFITYFNSIHKVKHSLTALFDKSNIIKSQLLGVLNIIDDGIIITDSSGIVHVCNEKALGILEEKSNIIGMQIRNIIPNIPFTKVLSNPSDTEYQLTKLNNIDISLKAVPVISSGKISGVLVIMSKFDEKEKSQHKLRSQLLGKGHRAKYSFSDIISQDESYNQLKSVAEKRARTGTTVLITGESGTGKEMFAQAIHNASDRKNQPFVAVNCAALPESLLESELFGYEEGAFTGAKKGGKPGLFELAHKGTIFLDEIGEMGYGLQARLLRVLEEREVMRVGGDSVINVDIRIIAATNRDLWPLLEDGKFRKDLYYRLNVFPIELPPLRHRIGDIALLFEYFKSIATAKFSLTKEAESALNDYPWYGNVRELKNCVEYLSSLDKDIIEMNDLKGIMRRQLSPQFKKEDAASDKEITAFINLIQPQVEEFRFILGCLYTNYLNKQRVGRRSILKTAQEKSVFLTEGQIRKDLSLLELHNLVRLSNGRGGTSITTLGIKAYKKLEE